jgi:aspartyl-tRNA(Asn)/glutamyl-tRNA(Gln) amidotransferase subunit A
VLPLAPTLDTVGVLAKTVEDSALILNAIAVRDVEDPSCASGGRDDYTSALGRGIEGLRIGVARDPLWSDCEAEVTTACEAALVELERLGAKLEEVSLPRLAALPELNEWAVLTAETSSTYAELIAKDPADLPPALRLGLSEPAVTYINTQRERRRVMEEMVGVLGTVDVLVSPTNAVAAPRRMRSEEADAVRRGVSRLPSRYNVTGVPAVTVPCGFTGAGLPIGLSVAGRPFDEITVLRVAQAYEQATEWHRQRPPI